MIATLGAFLETIAVLAAASLCASLVAHAGLVVVRRLRFAPAIRADLAFAIAALPAAVVVVGAVAISLPGALDRLGVVEDHCDEHGGHGHLCLSHPGVAAPALVAVGALVVAATLLRAGRWAAARHAAARDLGALLRLGVPAPERDGIVVVDGDVVLCHAAGAWAPRVLVSTRLLADLPPDLLAAALEHERAHLDRRDVLTRDVLAGCSLLAWPGAWSRVTVAWEEAAEEAADAAAAERVGGPVLARALVAVARMHLSPAPAAMPFVGARLTHRVRALLGEPPRHRPALALAVAPALGSLLVVWAARNADPLHHAAESALHLLLRG